MPLPTLFTIVFLLAAQGPVRTPPPAPRPRPAAPVSASDVSPTSSFEEGRIAFGRGEYAHAIAILRSLLYPDLRLESEGQVVQAHRMLGVSSLFENDPEFARQEFLRLLELRPDYRFDPLLDPANVVDFFNGVLREHEKQISALEERARLAREQDEEKKRRLLLTPAVIERRYVRNSFAINFLPFGAGQFQNGQRGKGWAFLGTETLLGGASLAAFTLNFALYGLTPKLRCKVDVGDANCPIDQVDRTDQDRSRLLTQVQVASGGLFFAVAAWGIVDALLHFHALVPLERSQWDTSAASDSARTKRPVKTLRISPFSIGQTFGAGLDLRF